MRQFPLIEDMSIVVFGSQQPELIDLRSHWAVLNSPTILRKQHSEKEFVAVVTVVTTVDGSEIPNNVNNGINYQPQLVQAGFLPSTVGKKLTFRFFTAYKSTRGTIQQTLPRLLRWTRNRDALAILRRGHWNCS